MVKEETTKKEEAQKPEWVKMKPSEIEELIVELAKKGESPAKIGLTLRDQYGIPKAKLFGKRISEVLKSKKVKFPTELEQVKSKMSNIEAHMAKNKQDISSKRHYTKALWMTKKLQSSQ